MQLLASSVHSLAADLLGWAPLLAGFAVFALVAVIALRHQARPATSRAPPAVRNAAAPLSRSDRAPEAVADAVATRISRVHDIVALQARASEQIDAAEYALEALLADCARVMTEPIGATGKPAPEPASEPAARPAPSASEPLAA